VAYPPEPLLLIVNKISFQTLFPLARMLSPSGIFFLFLAFFYFVNLAQSDTVLPNFVPKS